MNKYGTPYYKEHLNDEFDLRECFKNSYCWNFDSDIIGNIVQTNIAQLQSDISSLQNTVTDLQEEITRLQQNH